MSFPKSDPEPEPGELTSQRLLRSGRDDYRSIFDDGPVAMLLCEVGTLRVLGANKRAAALHGASPADLEGKSLFELRSVSDLTEAMLKRAVGHDIGLGFGYHTRVDGTTFAAQLSVTPSQLGAQPIWLCVLKSLDELLSPREGEQQRRLFEAVGRVAGGVAHDINNLLSVILSYSSLATSQLSESSAAQLDLLEIRGAAERASALTKQLLSLSRRGPASPKPLQLNDLIRRLEKLLRRLLDDGLRLELDLAPDLDQVLADPAQVERLLLQLMSDARAGAAPNGCLRLETRQIELENERHVRLCVHDSENHITPEAAALSDSASASAAWLESGPAHGTRFVAYFPSVVGPRNSNFPSAPAPREETVLVVQDNPHLRKTLKTYFTREGYRVFDAGGSLEARQLAEREARIDLLLSDFSLPDGTGVELGRTLRQRLPRLKLLLAIGHPDQRAALREDDLTRVINKPFDLQQFGALVQELLARTSP